MLQSDSPDEVLSDMASLKLTELTRLFDVLSETPGIWYVATPYSQYPLGVQQAWVAAVRVTAALAAAGVAVYSPVAHWHPIAKAGKLGNDRNYWLEMNKPMMRASCGIIVAKLPTWEDSWGVHHEIEFFEARSKPAIYLPVPIETF